MKSIIVILALFAYTCFAATNCPSSISTTFFKNQTFLAVSNANFVNKNIVVRDYATGTGYINVANKLIGAYGYNVKGVSGGGNVDVNVDAVAFVMNVLTEATVQWFFAEASVDVKVNSDGNVSFAGASASFLGFAARAFGIVEYEDTNGVAGFQLTDTILGGYDLSNPLLGIDWCNIETSVTTVTDVNNVQIKVRSASAITVDNVFGFRVTSTGSYAQIDGVNVDPNTIKIDFVINYYNNPNFAISLWTKGYTTNIPSDAAAHPNATIALVTGFAAVAAAGAVGVAKTISTDPTGNSNTGVAYGVAAGASGAAASLYSYFTYAQDADIQIFGGAAAKAAVFVSKTTTANPTGNGFWNIQTALSGGAYAKWGTVDMAIFSFNTFRPQQVYWDPSTGGNTPAPTNFAGTYSSAFFLMTIFAVLFALL